MTIYVIINSENLKIYVGQHKGNNLQKYLRQKQAHARHEESKQSRLYNAMRKYSSAVWSIYPLVSGVETKQELDDLEKHFIKVLKAQHEDVGYNISLGGEGGFKLGSRHSEDLKESFRGRHFSPATEIQKGEHRNAETEIRPGQHLSASTEFTTEKLNAYYAAGGKAGMEGKPQTEKWRREVLPVAIPALLEGRHRAIEEGRGGMTGLKHSVESKQKMSEVASLRTGEKNHFFGKHHSDESKAKNAAAHRRPWSPARRAAEDARRERLQLSL